MKARKRTPPTQRRQRYPREGLATVDDAVEFLQIGRSKVYEIINSGTIAIVEVCGVKRLPWPVLHELAKSPAASA